MKLACERCWDRNCSCTKEQLLEHSNKCLELKIARLEEEIEDLKLGGYRVLEDLTIKNCSTFYLDGFVFKTGERLDTSGGKFGISIICVAYPNKFKIITNNCNPVTIKKGTRFYKVVGIFE